MNYSSQQETTDKRNNNEIKTQANHTDDTTDNTWKHYNLNPASPKNKTVSRVIYSRIPLI